MNEKAPTRGQRLNQNLGGPDFSKLPRYSKDYDRQQALIELARKWVRYGCAETPKEAVRMLLGGEK